MTGRSRPAIRPLLTGIVDGLTLELPQDRFEPGDFPIERLDPIRADRR